MATLDIDERTKTDCKGFVLEIMASYYKEKGVRLVLIIPGAKGPVTIDSDNKKYKGEQDFDLFVKDLKNSIGARYIQTNLSTPIVLMDADVGDMRNFGYHVQYLYPAAAVTGRPWGVFQASGYESYIGDEKYHVEAPQVDNYTQDEFSDRNMYRWKFLDDLPIIRGSEMKILQPIKIQSLEIVLPELQLGGGYNNHEMSEGSAPEICPAYE